MNARPFTSFITCRLSASSISRFVLLCGTESVPQLFQLFHSYPGTATGEINASSCKWDQSSCRSKSTLRATFIGPIETCMMSLFYNHHTVNRYLPQNEKQKQKSCLLPSIHVHFQGLETIFNGIRKSSSPRRVCRNKTTACNIMGRILFLAATVMQKITCIMLRAAS